MFRLHNVKMRFGTPQEKLITFCASKLHILPEQITSLRVVRRSMDVRNKPDIFEVYTVELSVKNEQQLLKRRNRDVVPCDDRPYRFCVSGTRKLDVPPMIIGAGPAGLFCALELARHGYHPVIIERGKPVDERKRDVDAFWQRGILREDSNIQFGEGGAGTFSDGKLNTVVKDPCGRNRKVLEEFVKFGAKEEILYDARPHVGTDVLVPVIKAMRKEILSLGGSFRFSQTMTDLTFVNGKVKSITLSSGEVLPCEVLILAIGNSARDTFRRLYKAGVPMEAKSLAVGFRVEHLQDWVNRSMYGEFYSKQLPPAAYRLTAKTPSGRGVYSFCMCPGGYVVNASSIRETCAVNGMSYSLRNGTNANSAIVVTVGPQDFGSTEPLAGITFQDRIEQAAYKAGHGLIPQTTLRDYKLGISTNYRSPYESQLRGQGVNTDVSEIYPSFIKEAFLQGMSHFDKIMPGFASDDVILSGVETRTSSPVRILRNDVCQSQIEGIYPCGEGAGYAGGIVSSAIDGLRVAQAVAEVFCP